MQDHYTGKDIRTKELSDIFGKMRRRIASTAARLVVARCSAGSDAVIRQRNVGYTRTINNDKFCGSKDDNQSG